MTFKVMVVLNGTLSTSTALYSVQVRKYNSSIVDHELIRAHAIGNTTCSTGFTGTAIGNSRVPDGSMAVQSCRA